MIRLRLVRAGLTAAILLGVSSLVHAQTQQFGGPGGNTYLTWGSSPQQSVDVTYFIDTSTMTPLQTSLIQQAAGAWNAAGSGVHLVQIFTKPTANIQFVSANTGGTLSTVSIPSTAPGAGTYPNGASWFQITGQVTVTTNTWGGFLGYWNGVGAPPPGPPSWDYQALALDQFGQALGLGFAAPGDASSVMQPNSNFLLDTPGNHALSPTDVGSVVAIYGTPEPTTLALLGIGLALLGVSTKFRRTTLGL